MYNMIAGSLLLLGSAAFFSYDKIRTVRTQVRHLEEWIRFLLYTENHIRAFRTPLPEIVSSFRRDTDTPFAAVLMERGLADALDETALPGGAGKILSEYIDKAGGNYEAEELRLCRYTIDALERIQNTARRELQEKTKLYRTLPLMFALSVLLFFL